MNKIFKNILCSALLCGAFVGKGSILSVVFLEAPENLIKVIRPTELKEVLPRDPDLREAIRKCAENGSLEKIFEKLDKGLKPIIAKEIQEDYAELYEKLNVENTQNDIDYGTVIYSPSNLTAALKGKNLYVVMRENPTLLEAIKKSIANGEIKKVYHHLDPMLRIGLKQATNDIDTATANELENLENQVPEMKAQFEKLMRQASRQLDYLSTRTDAEMDRMNSKY